MAIYHFSAQIISRSQGKSAVASAAYRSAEKIYDERIGETFDYARKDKVYDKEILAPQNAPEWVQERSQLWNAVEAAEKRKDAQLAREINIALPVELTPEQNQRILREYVQKHFVDKGMVADIAYHNMDGDNPHAHVMLTTRELDANGFGKKNRDWNDRKQLEHARKAWAKHCNRELERVGSRERIDHRSLEAQGIDRQPQIHVGVHANEMAKRGVESERYQRNEKIKQFNKDLEKRPQLDLQKEYEKAKGQFAKVSQKNRDLYENVQHLNRVINAIEIDLKNELNKANNIQKLKADLERTNIFQFRERKELNTKLKTAEWSFNPNYIKQLNKQLTLLKEPRDEGLAQIESLKPIYKERFDHLDFIERIIQEGQRAANEKDRLHERKHDRGYDR